MSRRRLEEAASGRGRGPRQAAGARRSRLLRYPYEKYNARPITSHAPKRSHALRGRPNMMYTHPAADSRHTAHANGTRNGRGRFGSVWRRTSTPMLTSMNANSVPMLVKSYVSAASPINAHTATNTPVTIVVV